MAATQLYTTEEAGEILGVAGITVWRWVNQGRIKAVDLNDTGGKAKIRIRDDDLQKFIDERTFEVEPDADKTA